jgi:hypothetical protein
MAHTQQGIWKIKNEDEFKELVEQHDGNITLYQITSGYGEYYNVLVNIDFPNQESKDSFNTYAKLK